MSFLTVPPSSLCPQRDFIKLEFDAKLFSHYKRVVVDEQHHLVLHTSSHHTGCLCIEERTLVSGCLCVEERTLVSIFYSSSPAYFYAHEADGLRVYQTERLMIDEHDSNFEILVLSQGGYFSFIIEKTVSDEDFFFELGDDKFVLSGEQLMIIR